MIKCVSRLHSESWAIQPYNYFHIPKHQQRFNQAAVEVLPWMCNYIPHKTIRINMITHQCPDRRAWFRFVAVWYRYSIPTFLVLLYVHRLRLSQCLWSNLEKYDQIDCTISLGTQFVNKTMHNTPMYKSYAALCDDDESSHRTGGLCAQRTKKADWLSFNADNIILMKVYQDKQCG